MSRRSFCLRSVCTPFLILLLHLSACSAAWARGEEHRGNTPVSVANYQEWPGIMPVLNHPSRVYRTWVNGNEHFFYRGDTAALNDTLRKLAAGAGPREVVFRPGPGVTRTFSGTEEIRHGWRLQLIGGIARFLTDRPLGSRVWSPNPVLTVFVGGDVDLGKIEVPKELTVVPLPELKRRIREGFKSQDKTVRGWATGVLAEVDPYDPDSLTAIAELLKDPDLWVRLNAASVLVTFGRMAQPVVPLLRSTLETADEPLKAKVPMSIEAIEKAEDRSDAAREHRALLEQIDRYLAARKPSEK